MNRRRTAASVLLILGAVGVFVALPREPTPAPVVAMPAPPPSPAPPGVTLDPVEDAGAELPVAEEDDEAAPAEVMGRITVRVRDAKGAPASGAQVHCASPRWGWVETADESGIATIDLVAGAWDISAVHRTSSTAATKVSIDPQGKHVLDLTLEATARLSGIVVDEAGLPRANVRLTLTDPRARAPLEPLVSSADGTFSADIGAPEVEMLMADPRYAMWKRRLRLPDTALRVVAAEWRSLSLRVVDADGAHVRDAYVEISGTDFQIVQHSSGALSGLRMRAGPVKLRAVRRRSSGALERGETVVDLQAKTTPVTLTLRRSSGLTGTVIDPHGIPLANVDVVALAVAPSLRAVTEDERTKRAALLKETDANGRTGPDGRFDLVPGTAVDPTMSYRLQVLGLGVREPPAPILQQLGAAPVEIRLQSN